MARIRSAKPEFWTDPAMLALPRDLRFTFKGLWEVCADDEGRFLADPRIVKGQLWPVEDDISAKKLGSWLQTLHERGRIVLYDVGGARYGVITNWLKHQRISHPLPSKHPAPPNDAGTPPESFRNNSGTPPENFCTDVDFDVEKEKEEDVEAEARRKARGGGNGTARAQPRELPDLLQRLPEPRREALSRACAECDRPPALLAELRSALDGMHGPPLAPEVVGQAVHDLVANGHHRRFNARLVRRYLAGVDPPAITTNGRNGFHPPSPDAERAFDDVLQLIRGTPGGWRQITAETLAALPPPMRAGLRAADGVRALADADEFTLRSKRKLFTAAYLASPQEQPA